MWCLPPYLRTWCPLADYIVFLILIATVILIVYTLCMYSRKGDIGVFAIKDPNKLKESYPTKEAILNRLHELCVHEKEAVVWNRNLASSFLVAFLILYIVNALTLANFVLTMAIVFIAIELPGRWQNTHVKVQDTIEVNFLKALYATYP